MNFSNRPSQFDVISYAFLFLSVTEKGEMRVILCQFNRLVFIFSSVCSVILSPLDGATLSNKMPSFFEAPCIYSDTFSLPDRDIIICF